MIDSESREFTQEGEEFLSDTQVTDFDSRVFEEFKPETYPPLTQEQANQMNLNIGWAAGALDLTREVYIKSGGNSKEARFGLN